MMLTTGRDELNKNKRRDYDKISEPFSDKG
jgi:hypothetical protein